MKIIKRSDNSNLGFTPMRSIFDDFFTLPSLMDDMFSKSFNSKNLFADVWEEDNSYFIKMALPGINKEDINISTSQDSVTIKAESKQTEEKDSKKKYYFKTMESAYEQTFNLPAGVNADGAEAEYKDGVLMVKLPKAMESSEKKIQIK